MSTPEPTMLTEDDLVTSEAVALELPAATLGPRLVSGLIDALAGLALLIVLLIVLSIATAHTDDALAAVASILAVVVPLVVFPTVLETLTRGKSLGKLAMGLRTVRDDAGPISAQHALVRALIGVVEIYAFFGGPALLAAMLSTRGKRLGDYAAGTYVIRDRAQLRLAPPVPMPPPLAGWAAGADLAALPPRLAVAVRQYLLRLPQLDPGSRHAVGIRLAEAVGPYVAPAPPAGTPPEAFLAAVIAARRDRDAARLAREHALRQRLTTRF